MHAVPGRDHATLAAFHDRIIKRSWCDLARTYLFTDAICNASHTVVEHIQVLWLSKDMWQQKQLGRSIHRLANVRVCQYMYLLLLVYTNIDLGGCVSVHMRIDSLQKDTYK